MQLMIDTAVETSVGLRRIAAMLIFSADQIDGTVPAGTVAAPAAPALPAVIAPSPPAEVMKADTGHSSELPDPAKVFGGASNVVPLVPSVPTPPATIAAPPSAPITSPAPAGAVELDAAGFPHDARIHSQPPTTNANGLWRIRRSTAKNPCPPELIQQVEAELRAVYPAKAAPVQLSTVPLPPSVPVVPAPPMAGANAPPAPVTLPGVPSPGVPNAAPVAPGVPSGNDAFRMMMDKFSKEMGVNGRLNKTVMAPIFAALGVASWTDFFKRPELIPSITAEAERLLA